MDEKVIKMRSRAIGKNMRTAKLGYMVATSVENVRYVTGFSGDDSWAVVTGKNVYLLTDSRYVEQAKKELGMDHFEVRSWTAIHRHFYITQLSHSFAFGGHQP